MSRPLPAYAELHAISNFTFLRGASHPEALVRHASDLGYEALAITDECSLAAVVRAHTAARECNLKLIIGSELQLKDGQQDGPRIVLLATDRESYGNLSAVVTQARRAAKKGAYYLTQQDVEQTVAGCLVLWIPAREINQAHARWVATFFPGRTWIAVELLHNGLDYQRLQVLTGLSGMTSLPLVAAGDVHMHARHCRALQDTITAIRLGMPLHQVGQHLHSNSERHLRSLKTLSRFYPDALLSETLRISNLCHFSLDELRYEYPEELIPQGQTPAKHLRELTEAGIQQRWSQGIPDKVRKLVEHELRLIAELDYEPYFLTVYDIVRFARSKNILCQGRGSAANSAVCFCLGITEVDPARIETLFERFISKERDEPPDIDVDFENCRREEVIQYIYDKYGRDRAALAATVITYRPRSAVRDVGKALGLSLEQVDRLAKTIKWWDGKTIASERLQEAGLDPDNPVVQRVLTLTYALLGAPRHLSQHVGGFVISRGLLSRMVPIENAAMPERTVIQWDKDDLDALGLLKIDCLALGMLSAIHRSFDLIQSFYGRSMTMADIPADDPKVYEMIQHADTIGVFQIESRAQMAMLPRLKPDCFYDLVIEVAIVRPGPIQGDMVHPYLRRRQGLEDVTYPGKEVEAVLKRTLGVPIFQEQVIKLAMVAADFSPGEADQLRRSMAAWRRRGGLEHFEKRLIEGMGQRGYSKKFAQRIFHQIQGFGEYGFPESHAASFALLAYVSAWLKYYEPAAFTCALLNSQPMGFYAPAQLVQDGKRHGVTVYPVDVQSSNWDCTLEKIGEKTVDNGPALRLGFNRVKNLAYGAASRIVEFRKQQPAFTVEQLAQGAQLNRRDLEALADADALKSLSANRYQARWQTMGIETPLPLFADTASQEALPLLQPPTIGEDVVADYHSIGLTLRQHPLALLRSRLKKKNVLSAREVRQRKHGEQIKSTGLVISRQRPGTATGVIFITLEDETGLLNVIIWNTVFAQQRREILGAQLLTVYGEVQREEEVLHLIAHHVQDDSRLLGELTIKSRDFH
ncbi:MAG: error-prone DNA polymerase [Gammaproteobacteria bacterium]|nr:MAG: error-prone DNA polymerase [Gammaproteobacteria bacterium]